MQGSTSRRDFLRATSGAGFALGLGDLAFLGGLSPVSAAETRGVADILRFGDDIEPLVRLLEKTERPRIVDVFAKRVQEGASYREVLAALMLAGIRNIPPRPDVGFKFHAVLCLNSCHLASLASPDTERWLPLFYALDFFKGQQLYDVRESDWSLSSVRESDVPAPVQARVAFEEAMEIWEDDASDGAVAGLVRSCGASEVFDRVAYYGMRDFRDIGHKPIYLANSFRTLQCIGWQYAEPTMRSLVYALLNHHGDPNPSDSDLETDKPWKHNRQRVQEIPSDWRDGEISEDATLELLSTLREGTWLDASDHVVELLQTGVSPQSVCDALFLGSAELLMRQPNIVSLHAVTATNGLAYAYRTCASETTRRLLLLQNASFLVQFREDLKKRGPWSEDRIDTLEPQEEGRGADALDGIFRRVREEPLEAARRALAFLDGDARAAREFSTAARRFVFAKTRNSHDYKFSSAVLEDYFMISPRFRHRYLAASVFYLRGPEDGDNQVVKRARKALAS